jgi:hypothetical protein
MARTKNTGMDASEHIDAGMTNVLREDLPDGYGHALLMKLAPLKFMLEAPGVSAMGEIKEWLLDSESPTVPAGWIGDDWRVRSLLAIGECWGALSDDEGWDAVEAVLDAPKSSDAPKLWWVAFPGPGIKPEKKEGDGPDNPPAPPKAGTERPRYSVQVPWTELDVNAPDEKDASQEEIQVWIASGAARISGCFIHRHPTSNGSKNKCVVQCGQHEGCGMGWVIKSTDNGPWEIHGRKVTGPAGWDGARHSGPGVKEEKAEEADELEKAAVVAEAEAKKAEAETSAPEAETSAPEVSGAEAEASAAQAKAARDKKKKRPEVPQVCPPTGTGEHMHTHVHMNVRAPNLRRFPKA